MTRLFVSVVAGIGVWPMSLAPPPATKQALPSIDASSADCYAKVGTLLDLSGGKLTAEVREPYLTWAEGAVLQELRQKEQTIPQDCLAEVRGDATLRDAAFGAVFPPDPSILQNYAQLRAKLGSRLIASYSSLAIAVAIAKRVKGVETLEATGGSGSASANENQDFGHDYQPELWADESLRGMGNDDEKNYVRLVADFMRANQVAALDLYKNSGLQQQLVAFLNRHSVPTALIEETKQSIQFGERLKNAMVILGQRPTSRDQRPTAAAWLKHLIRIFESTPDSTPTVYGKVLPWPLFPLDKAPWPLLMPLAHTVPLSEAGYIWEAFKGEHGDDRYHTYGPYRGDDDAMPYELQPSKWFGDAWPDRIVHGGECAPISKGTVDLYSALGKPAMWAGQPGHANLISFKYLAEASKEPEFTALPTG